jgi:hypothetical protein
MIAESLAGAGRRIQANGLGFDARRIPAGVQPGAEVSVDPVIECLAFFGLALFPIRGNGRKERTRGWLTDAWRVGAFRWPSWSPLLDRWAIDALLDMAPRAAHDLRLARRLGISSWFETVPYKPKGSSDSTRAYASRRWDPHANATPRAARVRDARQRSRQRA